MMGRVRTIALTLPLAVAACAHSPRTTFLTLDAALPGAAPVPAYGGKPITVPAVHLPAVLDRVEFVRQDRAGEVRIDDLTHWAAPLGLLARDALIRDLAARLPAGAVLPPGSVGGEKTAVLDVTIADLTATPGGLEMSLFWRRLPSGQVRNMALKAPSSGDNAVDIARGFAALLGQAADQIATSLAAGG